MHSPSRIGLTVLLLIGGGYASFIGWKNYQIRQNEFYKMGAFYKKRFPKAGEFAISEFKTGDPERIMILPFLPVPDDCSTSERAILENTGWNFVELNKSEIKESALLFIQGFESTPTSAR